MRLFIAINFSQEIKDSLLDAIEQLRQQSFSGNFTRPENLHLTLAFIGESERLDDLRQVLDRIDSRPIHLELGGSGHFGDLYWAGLQKAPALDRLARMLRQDLIQQGFDIDRKAFRPHITLARQLQANQEPQLQLAPAQMRADRVSLMCSERINGKLTYTELYAKQL